MKRTRAFPRHWWKQWGIRPFVSWWLGVVLAVLAGIVHWPIKERAVPRLAADRR